MRAMAARIANLAEVCIAEVLLAHRNVHVGRIRYTILAMHRSGANSLHKTEVHTLCVVVPLLPLPHQPLSGIVRTWSGCGAD